MNETLTPKYGTYATDRLYKNTNVSNIDGARKFSATLMELVNYLDAKKYPVQKVEQKIRVVQHSGISFSEYPLGVIELVGRAADSQLLLDDPELKKFGLIICGGGDEDFSINEEDAWKYGWKSYNEVRQQIAGMNAKDPNGKCDLDYVVLAGARFSPKKYEEGFFRIKIGNILSKEKPIPARLIEACKKYLDTGKPTESIRMK